MTLTGVFDFSARVRALVGRRRSTEADRDQGENEDENEDQDQDEDEEDNTNRPAPRLRRVSHITAATASSSPQIGLST
ncbi:hypothetical protein E4U21_003054 [Claviceps maximensis]|nr:hypothetical protein E4U21_003054 [Claviceps maximensis]